MRILYDQHVPAKYIQAFEQEAWITVKTVRELLSSDASDVDIVEVVRDGWV